MPTAEEIREMQKLESDRETRRAQRHMRERDRAQGELQCASIFGNLLMQLPVAVETNATLIANSREYLELYSAKCLDAIRKPAEEPDDAEEATAPTDGATE